MSFPIIFIHRGPCRYLAGSIIQARQFNPDSEIFLLGDRFNSGFLSTRHFHCDVFLEGARKFESIYRHRSPHTIEYEGFCFQRWFILQAFLERQQLQHCLYLDSDVLLFADAAREARRFEDFDLTPSYFEDRGLIQFHGSPHCMFINQTSGLDRFCSFLLECYSSPGLIAQLDAHYQALQARNEPCGVSDMTIFGFYRELGRGPVADLYPIQNGTVFDHAMPDAAGFETQNGIKKIHWSNGLPYGRQARDGTSVRFHTLHFQGSAKRHLRAHLRFSSLRLHIQYQWNRLMAERGKILQKLHRMKR